MSNRLLSAAWRLTLPATDKVVLAALADCADDAGVTWVAMRSQRGKLDLITMTSLSERAIQGAIKRLCKEGHLARAETAGKGVTYSVLPRICCAPASAAPPQEVRPAGGAPTPAAAAGKPPVTPIPSDADASSGHARADAVIVVGMIEALISFATAAGKSKAKRASQLKPGWTPKALTGVAAETVRLWEPGRLERALDAFGNHHAARGSKMIDWDAAWRTWIGNEEKFGSRDRRNGQRPYHDSRERRGSLYAAVADDLARSGA